MDNPTKTVQVGGMWLAIASILMIAVLVFHGPIALDLNEQMTRIAGAAVRWSVVHWAAAAALSLYAVSGLLILTSRSRLVDGWWTSTAWAVIPVGALWTVTAAVVETTVMSDAAVSGNAETFEVWLAFAEGKATGFSFLALAVAVVAGNEARVSEGATPAWSAWAGSVAGVASFAGWALGMWFGIEGGNVLWLVSSVVMSVWTVWFGFALTRLNVV